MDKISRSSVNKLFGILCLIPCLNILISVISVIIVLISGGDIPYFYSNFAIPQFLFPLFTVSVFLILKRALKLKEKSLEDFATSLSCSDFLLIFLLFLGTTVLLDIISVINNLFFYLIGINLPELSFIAYTPTSPLRIFIFVVVIAVLPAISEELIYRYCIGGTLSYYSVPGAIIISSIAFGLMHGTLQQLLYAFIAGLFFGYIFLKTRNIKITIFLHFINNFISCILIFIQDMFGNNIYEIIYISKSVIFLLLGIISAVIYFNKNGFKIDYSEDLISVKHLVFSMFKSPFFYLFTTLEVGFMIINIIGI